MKDACAEQLPDKIVPIFSGGGTRLTAHIGILQALKELNLAFDQIVGVSGGSIVSALYACGWSLDDIVALAIETDFRQFRGFSLWRLLKDGGLSSGNTFEKWMDKQLQGCTFADIDTDLNIVATDVNGGGPVIFNRKNSPELKISEAVRFSMSIPLIFSFKSYKNHLLVDGVILSEDALFRDWSNCGASNVCFRLQSSQETQSLTPKGLIKLPEFVLLLIRTFMNALSREYVHENYWHNTLVVNTGSISSVDFALSDEQKRILYQQGYNAAKQYLPQKLAHLHVNPT